MIINYNELTPELARAGCFVLGMPNDAYHAYEGVSKSSLDLISRSPAHYMCGAKQKSKRHLELGTALHTAVLEPERFLNEYMILKGVKARTATEYKQAVKANGSELVLIETEACNIISLQETVAATPEVNDELASCTMFEVSAFKEINGVLCRCRFDAINLETHFTIDLKSTQNSSREEFSESVYNYRYHVQDAFYSLVYREITGHELTFKFLAVENEPPHCPMIYELDDEAKRFGLLDVERDMVAYNAATDSHEWKGYEQTNEPLTLPSWALNAYEDQIDKDIV